MIPELKIHLLGSFQIENGPQSLDVLGWRRQPKSLVKLLALAPGHRLHKEQVLETLWPDEDPDKAFNSLRQVLFLGRKGLEQAGLPGSEILPLKEGWLEFCPEGRVWIDVEQFEQAAGSARRNKEPGAYEAALAAYPGELLPEDRFEDWAAYRRESLAALYLQLIKDLASLYEASQDYQPAIEWLQRALESDPLDEDLHTSLMRLYALAGLRAPALRQYESLQQALRRELDLEPAAATTRLYQAILSNRFPEKKEAPRPAPEAAVMAAPPTPARHNLPAQWTSFVGRACEIAELKADLAAPEDETAPRLVTLLGPGGVGKTRLAQRVTRELVANYPDGAWWVELADLTDGVYIPQAVAAALGVRANSGAPVLEAIVAYLRERGLLLVLDNCEHLIEASAGVVQQLLSACPRLRLLTTSRMALGIRGEVVRRLGGLDTQGEAGEEPDAARLFAARARLLKPNFRLEDGNRETVNRICQRLDGLPLAIELAAARLNVLSLAQVEQRLGDRFRLLAANSQAIIERQRSLQAVIDWSYHLLTTAERSLFARLSIFRGGWTLEAAEAVCNPTGDLPIDILDGISRLVDHSLVVPTGDESEPRFDLLDTLRAYGLEKQALSGDKDRVKAWHAQYFARLVEELEQARKSAPRSEWAQRITADHDNIRLALEAASEGIEVEAGLRLAGAIRMFWITQCHWSEGRQRVDKLLSHPAAAGHSAARARALRTTASMSGLMGDKLTARDRFLEALAIYQELGDQPGTALLLAHVAEEHGSLGDYPESRRLFEQSLSIYRQLDDSEGISYVLLLLGNLAEKQRDYDQSYAFAAECLQISRAAGSFSFSAAGNLARLARLRGEYELALSLGEETLAYSRKTSFTYIIPFDLSDLGLTLLRMEKLEQAASNFRQSLEMIKDRAASEPTSTYGVVILTCLGLGELALLKRDPRRAAWLLAAAERWILIEPDEWSIEQADCVRLLAEARGRLPAEEYEAAVVEGQEISLVALVKRLLAEESPEEKNIHPPG